MNDNSVMMWLYFLYSSIYQVQVVVVVSFLFIRPPPLFLFFFFFFFFFSFLGVACIRDVWIRTVRPLKFGSARRIGGRYVHEIDFGSQRRG